MWPEDKQWPLAGEFGECEYLPKICVFRNMRDSPDSPTFAKHFARTRQTRRHLPKAISEKNVTCLAKFERVMRESREFGASGHCLPEDQKTALESNNKQIKNDIAC
jgi:hypothetical protein